MESKHVMFVTSAPKEHADAVRNAMGEAGAGKWGNYSQCSFSYEGEGRFFPEGGAEPTYGKKGELNLVPEERIEMLCERVIVKGVIAALKRVHPYEEPTYHYFPIEIE